MFCRKLSWGFLTLSIILVAAAAGAAEDPYRHKRLFTDRYLHEPVRTGDCTVCHELHFPEGDAQLKKSLPELCYLCHETFKGTAVHSPVSNGWCDRCHYPHSSPRKDLLSKPVGALCLTCHSKRKGGRHGDLVFSEDCTTCHDPHASNSPRLLRGNFEGRCGTCHQEILAGENRHSALEEYDCTECHNPHTSPPEPPSACTDCHDDMVDGPFIHGAVEEGCTVCHDPHSGPRPRQLINPLPELCLECHPDRAGGKHGRTQVGADCTRCHDPHVSERKSLLNDWSQSAPCAACHLNVIQKEVQHTPVRENRCDRCHDPHAQPPAQPAVCSDCHRDILAGRFTHEPAAEECENCHDPHGSANRLQLTEDVPALCVSCHDDKEGGLHGRVQLHEQCTNCHNPHSALQPKLLTILKDTAPCESCHRTQRSGPVLHSGLVDNECDQCHDPHSDPPEATLSCLDCHDYLLQGGVRHAPVEEGCLDCHASHSGQHPSLLLEDVPALCILCHDDREGGKHGKTVLGTACLDCHVPHSSQRRSLLNDLDKSSCTDCHRNKGRAQRLHSALEEYPCSHCHDPHAEQPRMPPLGCDQCHQAVADRNPAHGSPSQGRCTLCHDPHGSDAQAVAQAKVEFTRDECLQCHRDIARKLETGPSRHEPVREGECSDCHTNHSGEAPFTNAFFDGRMYVPFRPEAYDLCFQCHSLTLVQEDYTETATRFRHKRWNLHTHHVVRDGERGFSCWVCHDVHASRQPHLINAEVQYNPVYRLRIDYRALEGGGQCQTTCHKAQDYTR